MENSFASEIKKKLQSLDQELERAYTRRDFLKIAGITLTLSTATLFGAPHLRKFYSKKSMLTGDFTTGSSTNSTQNTLTLEDDEKTNPTLYLIITDGKIEKTEANNATKGKRDAILGNKATGALSNGKDSYTINGKIKKFFTNGEPGIIYNNERLTVKELKNICERSETTEDYRGTFVNYEDSLFDSDEWVTPDEYGASGDGSKDDKDALKQAIENNSNIRIPEGTYRIDSTIQLENTEDKLIKGPGEIKFNSENRSFLFRFENSQNIHFKDLKLNGNSENNADAGAFKFDRCVNISVNNCEIYNWGDRDGTQSDYHTIGADSSIRAEFIGNFIHDVSAKGISWYSHDGNSQPNHECLMAHNRVRRTGEDGLFAGTVQTIERAEQILFIENDIKTTRDNYGIRIGGNQPIKVKIRGNRIENPSNTAITVKTLADSRAQIANNECIGGGINFKGRPNISGKIQNNTLRETNQGIRIFFGCQDVDIIGNTTYKILLDGGSNFLIKDNNIGEGGIIRRDKPENVQVESNNIA